LAAFSLSFAAHTQDALLPQEVVKAAVERVEPCVVQIETIGGLEQVNRDLVGTAPATGLIVASDGYILTSAFHFRQQPSSILVTLSGERKVPARIVSRDYARMLVLLKVDAAVPLPVPESVPTDDIRVGQWAVAVGRIFDAAVPNVSVGIVSATERIWGRAIQTDAKVSPANYGGPLIDVAGRVLGVLVPLASPTNNEMAGAELYDSGIGFAIPLADVMSDLDRMKLGEDLHPGVLGITLQGTNIFDDPAVIASCLPQSPALAAGLKAGDRIVEADGVPVSNHVQLRHALGAKLAGDVVDLVVLRNEKRIQARVRLAEEIEPYDEPFLGILPMRNPPDRKPIVVRFVYPDSPADVGGLRRGDELVAIDGLKPTSLADWRGQLALKGPNALATIEYRREGKGHTIQISLGRVPERLPDSLPPPFDADPLPDAEKQPTVGLVQIKLPDLPNRCIAYVPESYHPAAPHGLVIWLNEAGPVDQHELITLWQPWCAERQLIVLAPESTDEARWRVTDILVIRQMVAQLMKDYSIDRSRVVVHGYRAGGTMAYRYAFASRQSVRGVAIAEAGFPLDISEPGNDPANRLDIYLAIRESGPMGERMRTDVRRFQRARLTVSVAPVRSDRYLNASEIGHLATWTDTLDRL
jgi:serine protease Do